MCLGIPGRLTTVFAEEGVCVGKVDFGGVSRTVCLAYLPEAQEGDYVIVHAGFAISRVDETEARRTLALVQELEASTPQEDT
jgi:hydrogenase expression/formation protein HypC